MADKGVEGYFRARNGIAALSRTPVLTEGTLVGASRPAEPSMVAIRKVRLTSIALKNSA